MVDYDLVDAEILTALNKIGAVNVKTTIECGYSQGAADKVLVDGTQKKRRVLLTGNYNDINERVYKPCFHGGIILINHPRPTGDIVYARMKAFSQSGGRSEAKGHVTYLNEDKAIVHKLHKEKIEVAF
jgi:hypothetical protein